MLKTRPSPEQYFRFDGVDWKFYESMLERLRDRRVFITYDRGSLEIMSPSRKHERHKSFLGRLIETLTQELNVPISSGGSTTFKREDLEKGLEPDECYWIAHEAQVRDVDEIDLTRHPPPDLAIEVEISTRLLNRASIYAALGVPELWRYDGEVLSVMELGADGRYVERDGSPSFPMLPLDEVRRFLVRRATEGETALMREFAEWVRRTLSVPGEGR